jgi:uncharacterized protein
MKLRYQGILLIICIAIIALSHRLVHILTESWWFNTLNFSEVFWTKLTWQILIWVVTFAAYGLFIWGNYRIAMGQTRYSAFNFFEDSPFAEHANTFANIIALVLIGFVAFCAASISVPTWETILKYLHSKAFGNPDPIFQRDISFYIFKLPLYETIWNWFLFLLIWALTASVLVYILKDSLTIRRNGRNIWNSKAKSHVSLLLAGIAGLIAVDFWLKRFSLLYSTTLSLVLAIQMFTLDCLPTG